MKKRFLPFSLLLVIMILGQAMAFADNGGHYVPRNDNQTGEAFMSELRANQNTGLIDPALMLKAQQSVTRYEPESPLYWLSMGPNNMGGQTTAVLYDNRKNSHGNPNGVVYIGSMGGGVYKSYNHGITWHQVGDKCLMVSCMVQDADGVIYVGTGDGNNAATYNGLDQQSYDNSFVGNGIWKLEDDVFTLIESTKPSMNDVEAWSFVNDLAIAGNKLFAATDGGLKYSSDKGATWNVAVEGAADEVKVIEGEKVMASVDGKLYIGTADDMVCHSESSIQYDEDHNIIALPTAAALLDIAAAPSNPNVLYAACIKADGTHTGIYVTYDQGATWAIALPNVTVNQGHNVYAGYGLMHHGIVVNPDNDGIFYILGQNLWQLTRPASGTGNYLTSQLTDGGSDSYISDTYLHIGLRAMAYNPNNHNEYYIGTNGGIYKGTLHGGEFTFKNCNRNYITTRMFNIAYSGNDTRVLAAGLDHGTVKIEGDANTNSVAYGEWMNANGYNDGAYDASAEAGPCAISLINPNTMFVTYKGGGFQRTQTAGADWVSTNFLENLSISTSSFRMPIMLFESFNDDTNPATIWYKNTTGETIASGTTLQCMSNNEYPFNYTLTSSLHAGDSIEVHDPISARLFVSFTNALYMTFESLQFGVAPTWYCLANSGKTGFTGEPLCMGLSADGDDMFVGMKNGKLFRVSGILDVVDANSVAFDSAYCVVSTTEIELPTSGQCVTSVAVDPRNANNVVVTLGNYGNDSYVLYSTNALSSSPTFTSKQANLPKMPVYSSVIDMSTGDVIIGTERGIYRTDNIASPNWAADGHMMGEVPVMELKQQLVYKEAEQTINHTEEGDFITDYAGVYNTGVIYAATYGRGVFRCENYKKEFDNVPENPVVAEMSANIYPNPVHETASIRFEAKGNNSVSLQVFDMMGRMVMSQDMGRFAEGMHEVNVSMDNLSSGAYIMRLSQGSNTTSLKFLVY